MAGLLDTLAGSSDPSTADPTTGLVDAQRKQLAYGILGQAGAALLAAGAPTMPGSGQQAAAFAQLGQIPGNVAQQQSQMVQQNAMAQQVKLRQAKVEQDKAAQAYVSSPEFQNTLSQMPEVLRGQAMVNIKAGDYGAATKVVGDFVRMQMQLTHENAVLNAAPPTVTHDADGNPIVYDRKTRTWNPLGPTTDRQTAYGLSGGSASGSAPATMPTYGQPNAPSLPDGTPISDSSAPPQQAANSYPNASINPGLPYDQAFGFRGGADYALGRLQGVTGFGKISPELNLQNAAVAQYDKMRTELLNEARSESPGSSRIKSAYNAINETLPVAGSVFHDAPYALKQLSAAKDSIKTELDNTTRMFQAPATKPAERQKLALDISSLRKNYDNLSIVVDGLAQKQGGSKPQSTPTRLKFNPASGKIE